MSLRRLLLIPLLLSPPLAAQNRPVPVRDAAGAAPPDVPRDIDAYVARVLATFHTPGAAIAIVRDGRMVFAKGYGVRRLGSPEPVDERTVFQVASNTKAFTAAALAMLVDSGRIRWDDRVVDRLPGFAMSDPYVSREMRVWDLLVHNSGLPLGGGDLLWFHADYPRREIVRRLRFVPLATSFRSAYAYDNVLYIAAGELVGAVTGRPWDEFVRERIFVPLGMTGTGTTDSARTAALNIAAPHGMVDGRLQVVNVDSADNIGAAGGIHSSVVDMAQWIRVQLDSGRIEGDRRLWSARRTTEMWHGRTVLNPPGGANLAAYALGWNVYDQQGLKIVTHTGGLAGMISRVLLIPGRRTGFVILTNAESAAMTALTLYLRAFYTGAPAADHIAQLTAPGAVFDERAWEAKLDSQHVRGTAPSLPLARYAGRYTDPWYGDVGMSEEGGHLVIRFSHSPTYTADLEHWHHDVFRARFRVRSIPDAWVYFALRPDGSIELMRMAAVSPSTDFSYNWHDLRLVPARN